MNVTDFLTTARADQGYQTCFSGHSSEREAHLPSVPVLLLHPSALPESKAVTETEGE